MPDSWDSNDGQTQHLDENGNTVGAQIGVRVWISPATGCAYHSPRTDTNPHLAIPLDAESLARLRERIFLAIREPQCGTSFTRVIHCQNGGHVPCECQQSADAVLAALGLEAS